MLSLLSQTSAPSRRHLQDALRPLALLICLTIFLVSAPLARAGEPYSQAQPSSSADESGKPLTLSSLTGLDKYGIDMSLWGWFGYAAFNQDDYDRFWTTELELDVTKSFSDVAAISVDWEFVDYNDEMRGNLEQIFGSVMLSRRYGMVLTAGKFNSPFGVEPRDFWDRLTASPSLLFRAQPQDLRGVMLTAPLPNTDITLRPFVVSGFADEDHIPDWPAFGLMGEYRPSDRVDLGLTGWIGPGVELAEGGYGGAGYGSSAENIELQNTWWNDSFKSAERGQLYFFDAQASVKPRPDLTLQSEFLIGVTNVDGYMSHWLGVMLLGSFDIDDHLRAYAMWSYLDDTDWVVYQEVQRRHEVSIGMAYRLNRYIEFRGEYRHDFSDVVEDVDSIAIHATVGF